jgi:class 3 adenylate cyclase
MPKSREYEGVFLIADLSGYSALTEAHGDMSAAKIVNRYVDLVRSVLQPGTHLAERTGDEVLIMGTEAMGVLRTAIGLRGAVEKEPYFPVVHAGMHAGKVLEQDGHYYGTTLNLTSRIATRAWGGQILCTEQVALLAGGVRDVEFRALGSMYFKNITEPAAIYEVITEHQKAEVKRLDPVCRMQVGIETAPARLPFREETYYFCSFECARVFAEHPDRYVKK